MPTDFGFHNILENDGIGLAVTGMSIVFTALVLVAGFIAALPGALSRLAPILPPELVRHAAAAEDEEAVAVAVAYALRSRAGARKVEPGGKS